MLPVGGVKSKCASSHVLPAPSCAFAGAPLTLGDCVKWAAGRLVAAGDPVIANNVDARGWALLLALAPCRPATTLRWSATSRLSARNPRRKDNR